MNEIVVRAKGIVTVAPELMEAVIQSNSLEVKIQEAKNTVQETDERVIEAMKQAGLTQAIIAGTTYTIVPSHTRTTIDSKRLKADKPELVEEYSKTSVVKESYRKVLAE